MRAVALLVLLFVGCARTPTACGPLPEGRKPSATEAARLGEDERRCGPCWREFHRHTCGALTCTAEGWR